MMTYEYTLYESHRNRHLGKMRREGSFVWNHALALQKRYYSLYGKYIDVVRMQKHFSRRIKPNLLHSQSVQEILQRLDDSYQRFFNKKAKRPPKFKKAERFSSFVFKGDGGYKLYANMIVINKVKRHFKFFYSRPYNGKVKTVRIKRRPTGKYSLYIVTDDSAGYIPKSKSQIPTENLNEGVTHNGAATICGAVGMDFGLKTFLTLSDRTTRTCPGYLQKSLGDVAKLNRRLSRCQKGSNHYAETRARLARLHEHIANSRKDWHWKLAHELCRQYDIICVEDLNLAGMKKMWGRKVSDMGYGSFVEILNQVANKYKVKVVKVDRFYASSKTCSKCGYVNQGLTLRQRTWTCPDCGSVHNRDLNAAINILNKGLTLLK